MADNFYAIKIKSWDGYYVSEHVLGDAYTEEEIEVIEKTLKESGYLFHNVLGEDDPYWWRIFPNTDGDRPTPDNNNWLVHVRIEEVACSRTPIDTVIRLIQTGEECLS